MKFILSLLFLASCSSVRVHAPRPGHPPKVTKTENPVSVTFRTLPLGKRGPRVDRDGYAFQYNNECKISHWVSYSIASEDLIENVKRTNDFKEDEELGPTQATLEDYSGSGYDRGHLARAHLFTKSRKLMSESFRLSNMVPQDPYMNQNGAWAGTEGFEYNVAKNANKVLVVSGPILGSNKSIGRGKVCVPLALFKVIYNPERNIGIGFLIPNHKTKVIFESYLTTIDEVERISGIDFFHEIEDRAEEAFESTSDLKAWNYGSDFKLASKTIDSNSSGGLIKKSKSNICHDPSSRYYSRTKNFQPFQVMEDCIASGGRMPK